MKNKTKIIDYVKDKVKLISPRVRLLESASEIADIVISKEEKYSKMSMTEMRNLSYRMSEEIQSGKPIDNYLIDALAIARETIWRIHKQKAYKVQIIGAIIVHYGDFAEMKTGEGKTLSLLLVSYVNALTKKGVHIVTVNEYLVERDMKYSQDALGELGITVGYITSSMSPEQKKKMYACDITYVSNSELGFDYLRDNMVDNINDKMQRGLNFAIVDEADSVLIDEARTPLIIAANPEEGVDLYKEVDKFVKSLEPNDYVIDLESHAINLNDNGIKKTEQHFKIKNLYDIENSEIVHKIMNSLRANYIMELGKEYILKPSPKTGLNEIALVDAFTGRVMEGRMYSAGLHQAIQAKENVQIEPENVTVATITYQSFFRLYSKLAGVSGTALTEKNEFLNIYNMVVVDIPTNKPVIRVDQPDYIFGSKQVKWKYVVAEIKRRHEKGQPVLVGTVSVEDSELLHRLLDHVKIPHKVLNAKNDTIEAEIIKKAGLKGAVTIATNMAGRGTDIKLGEGVKELGGLFVLGTERNESRRIDNQLRGRSGRQGDPGESRFFISLQDSLFKRFATDKFDKAQYKLGDDVIDLKFFSHLLDKTQKRIENLNFDIRKNLIDYDYVLSEQRELIYKQRDIILVTNDMLSIIKKMIPRVIDVLISINRDDENISVIHIDNLLNDIKEKLGINLEIDKEKIRELQNSQIYTLITNKITLILEEKYKQNPSQDEVNSRWRSITISSIDRNWTKFLDKIQKLRDGVALRSYEQKSPLNIYVEDSDRLFYNITINIATEVIKEIINSDALSSSTSVGATKLKFVDNNNLVIDESQIVGEKSKHSVDDIELSPTKNDDEKQEMENKEKVMSDNKTNQLHENISSVVDEILNGKANRKPETTTNSTISPPPPIPTIKKEEIKQNDFLKQVMDVVDKDIETKPIDLSEIDNLIKEDKKETIFNTTSVKDIPPPPPIPTIKPQQTSQSSEKISVSPSFNQTASKPSEFNNDIVDHNDKDFVNNKFLREDSIRPESYNHNLRIDRKDQLEIEKIQKELDEKHLEIINEKFNTIIGIKDENIKSLIDKSIELENEIENGKIEYSKKIEDIYNQENEQLRIIKDQLESLLVEKKRMENIIHDYQIKELEAEQQRLADERDAMEQARLKMEAERLALEEKNKIVQENEFVMQQSGQQRFAQRPIGLSSLNKKPKNIQFSTIPRGRINTIASFSRIGQMDQNRKSDSLNTIYSLKDAKRK